MPTPAELEDFQQAQEDVHTLLIAGLVSFWADVVEANPAEALEDLRAFALSLVEEYGQIASATAVDFYESVRPDGAPAFDPIPVVRDDLLSGGTLNWATEPLLAETWQDALDRTAAAVQKSVKEAMVETIGQASEDDPLDVRFARWPGNPNPCAWCVLRASRGAVYWSEVTAERGDHVKCGCQVTPVFPGEQLPYLRKPYIEQFQAGAATAAEPGRKALLAAMRRANGTR